MKRLVLLDNEAVQALGGGPAHLKHRRVVYEVLTAASRTTRGRQVSVAVPTTVRVEAGWDRTSSAWAFVNRLRIADIPLSVEHADAAAGIRKRTGVSVTDAHIGSAIRNAEQDHVTVVTSDPRDIRKMAEGRHVDVVSI